MASGCGLFDCLGPLNGLEPLDGIRPLDGFELASPARVSGAAIHSSPVSSSLIRAALSPQLLRTAVLERVRALGEAEVQLSEKRDVLKAKVHIFVESTQEVLGIAIRISAGADGATAEWRRQSGDALQFHRFFVQVKNAIESHGGSNSSRGKTSECFDYASVFSDTSLEDAIATAQVMPEEAAASLARSIPHIDASEVAKLPRYIRIVEHWLMSTDVRVVGPACSLAKHLCEVDSTHAPTVMAIAVEQAELALGPDGAGAA